MKNLFVIKIGGNIIDDETSFLLFCGQFAAIKGKKNTGAWRRKTGNKTGRQLGIQQQMVDGRRITDAETLKIVTMVYAGYINKNIVAQLQALGCNAIGLTGADANLLMQTKEFTPTIDYGFVGDVDSSAFNAECWTGLLAEGLDSCNGADHT